jgi:hypothetical protein
LEGNLGRCPIHSPPANSRGFFTLWWKSLIGDDFENDGEYWEFQSLEKMEKWSLKMIPFKNLICFSAKYKDSEPYYPISYDEKIKDIAQDVGSIIKIQCVIAQTGLKDEQQYHFTIVLDSAKIDFNITPFLESL